MTVLITGGSGYIGSHVVRLCQELNIATAIVDEVSPKFNYPQDKFLKLNLSADTAVAQLFSFIKEQNVTAIIHFAARKQVGESVLKPLMYYQQNIAGMINLLAAVAETDVEKLVFSSSAAVYGIPPTGIATESDQLNPINPYGETKMVGELMSKAIEATGTLRTVSLRYFNVAGAGWVDLKDQQVMNLIPITIDRLNKGKTPVIFGDDYSTSDGTCIRDYVHVMDLAEAHILALNYLDKEEREFDTFNVGTGRGHSVLEVLNMIRQVSELSFSHHIAERRAGDPAVLIASNERIARTLNWKPSRSLEDMVVSAL